MLPRAAIAAAMLVSLACSSGSAGAPDGNGGANGGAGGEGGEASGHGGGTAGSLGHGGGTAGSLGHGGGAAGAGGLGGASVAGAGGGAAGHGGGGAGGGKPTSGSPCESNNDCGSSTFLFCVAPGEFLGCGTCRQAQGSCSSDTDCGGSPDGGVAVAHMICDVAPSTQCFCTSVNICQIGCRTKSDCAGGQGCNARHQCQETCTPGAATCPANYSCSPDGFCTQNSCTDDSQCSGACVNGRCYSTPGTCQLRPA